MKSQKFNSGSSIEMIGAAQREDQAKSLANQYNAEVSVDGDEYVMESTWSKWVEGYPYTSDSTHAVVSLARPFRENESEMEVAFCKDAAEVEHWQEVFADNEFDDEPIVDVLSISELVNLLGDMYVYAKVKIESDEFRPHDFFHVKNHHHTCRFYRTMSSRNVV